MLAYDTMRLAATEWNAANNLKGDDRVSPERTQDGLTDSNFDGQIVLEWSVFPADDEQPWAARVTACSEDHEQAVVPEVLILLI